MSDLPPRTKRTYPRATALIGGLFAGTLAGLVAYLIIGLVGFVVAFIFGTIIGSRAVLLALRPRQLPP